MSTDLDVEAHEQRAHALAMARTICRWALAAVVIVTAALTYSCDRDYHARLANAERDAARATAIAEECRRWTP